MSVVTTSAVRLPGMIWESRGYAGRGEGDLVGSLPGRTALVCGGARGVFEEFEAASRLYPDAVVFAANDVGMYLPRVDHWVSLHHANFAGWTAVRNHRAHGARLHSYEQGKNVWIDHVWDALTPVFALSGYFAMQIAWIMGAEKIVLCGCPGDPTPRFFEARLPKPFGYGGGAMASDEGVKKQLENEMERIPEFRAAVRSCSGATKQFFGGIDG